MNKVLVILNLLLVKRWKNLFSKNLVSQNHLLLQIIMNSYKKLSRVLILLQNPKRNLSQVFRKIQTNPDLLHKL